MSCVKRGGRGWDLEVETVAATRVRIRGVGKAELADVQVGDQVVALILQSGGRLEARWAAVISE